MALQLQKPVFLWVNEGRGQRVEPSAVLDILSLRTSTYTSPVYYMDFLLYFSPCAEGWDLARLLATQKMTTS